MTKQCRSMTVFIHGHMRCLHALCLTCVGLQLLAVVNQGIVMEAQINLDGCDSSLVVKRMHS